MVHEPQPGLARAARAGENMLGYGIPPPPPSPPPQASGTAAEELCAYNQQAFKTCAAGTSCLVSDEQINPNNGQMQSRSHCCRNNHWWWMCKYTYRITGVIEYCRDDGQCDYGSGQCSGNGDSMTGMKYGICSGSWLPDRIDYDSNNMYVVTDPTTYYISDITGDTEGWAASQVLATHIYMSWIAAQNANGNDLVYTNFYGGTTTLTPPADPSTVTFTLANDPNTQAGWKSLASNYFLQQCARLLGTQRRAQPRVLLRYVGPRDAGVHVGALCLLHRHHVPRRLAPDAVEPASAGATGGDACSYYGGNRVTANEPTTPCTTAKVATTQTQPFVTYFRPPPVASWPRTGQASAAAAAASASYSRPPSPLPPAPPMRPPAPPQPPVSPPPPPVPSLPPPQPRPPPPPPLPPPPQPSPPPSPSPPPGIPVDPLRNADGTYNVTTATGPSSSSRRKLMMGRVRGCE